MAAAGKSDGHPVKASSDMPQEDAQAAGTEECHATLHFGEKALPFVWRADIPAKAFGELFRDAVRSFIGRSTLEGVELQANATPSSQPSRATPRDIFQGRVASVHIVVPEFSKGGAPGVPDVPSGVAHVPEDPSAGQRPAIKAKSGSTTSARRKPEGKFQKKGGSQLDFVKMMELNKNPVAPLPPGLRLTAEEVAKHQKASDCWTIFQGKVYDITLYVSFHPGGKGQIMKGAGKDCTDLYNESHPWVSAEGLIGRLCLGTLEPAEAPSAVVKVGSES